MTTDSSDTAPTVRSASRPAVRIAMLGDRGIPAHYGGFSTLVEEVSTRLVANYGIDVTVYCRTQYLDSHPPEFKGVRLVYLTAPGGKSFESLLHSQRAILHAALRRFDLAFIVDPGNSPLTLPLVLRRIPFVIHTDGLGWQREKWNAFQRRYYHWSEWLSAHLATGLVCDSLVMRDHYLNSYGAACTYIPYGGIVGDPPNDSTPAHYGLEAGKYHLVVARLEPENNIDFIIRDYKASKARFPLVYVGGVRFESDYSRRVMAEAGDRVKCLGPIFKSDILNGLYKHCRTYIHGHQVGGTNPSLLRAMAAGAACVPIEVPFHREVLREDARFFSKVPGQLATIIEELEADDAAAANFGKRAAERARKFYRWDAVAAGYAEFFTHLVEARQSGDRVAMLAIPNVYRPEAFADKDPGDPV